MRINRPRLLLKIVIIVVYLSGESVSAVTLRERWIAEGNRARAVIGSICLGCDNTPAQGRRLGRQPSAFVNPIAVLERSTRISTASPTIKEPKVVVVRTPAVDRTLVSSNVRRSRSYAQLLARRKQEKLQRARRYAALLARRRAQAAAQAAAREAAERYNIELGQVRQVPE
jgi:hypothetical protein